MPLHCPVRCAYTKEVLTVGIDEVGRGAWAGPLVAGAVLWPAGLSESELRAWQLGDSKKLTKQQRVISDAAIQQLALAVGLGWVEADEIDKIGLTAAVGVAMHRALGQIRTAYDEVVVDGSYNFLADMPSARCLIRADSLIPAVSAASIVAKVARDNWMAAQAANLFPDYGFERHVGYGTREHHEALRRLGPCDLHRRSYRPVAQVC